MSQLVLYPTACEKNTIPVIEFCVLEVSVVYYFLSCTCSVVVSEFYFDVHLVFIFSICVNLDES